MHPFNASPYRREVEFVLEAVSEAARLSAFVLEQKKNTPLEKDDHSPVTVADFAIQALVAERLGRIFPADSLVGEEDSAVLREEKNRGLLEAIVALVSRHRAGASPEAVCQWIDVGKGEPAARFWTLDPIDGTKGFIRGGQYAVAFALLEDGEIKVSALACPRLRFSPEGPLSPLEVGQAGDGGIVALAVRGEGAFVSPLDEKKAWRRLFVSATADPHCARLLRSVDPAHTDMQKVSALLGALGATAPQLALDSQVKFAVLASGGADFFVRFPPKEKLNYAEKIWDQAPGALILEEAGGRVSDVHGKPFDWKTGKALTQNHGVFASNGHLHGAVLEAMSLWSGFSG